MRSEAAASGASYEWARAKKLALPDQLVNSGTAPQVTFDDFQSSPGSTIGSSGSYIRPAEDGLYSLVARVFWASVGGAGFEAELYFGGVDPFNYAAYNGASVFTDYNSVTTAVLIARIAAGSLLAVYARQQSGVGWTISGSGGTYFEVIRLGSIDMADRAFP